MTTEAEKQKALLMSMADRANQFEAERDAAEKRNADLVDLLRQAAPYVPQVSPLRLLINATVFESLVNAPLPGQEKPEIDKNCYWCFGDGITHPEQGVTYGGKRCSFCKSADARGLSKQET